MHDAHKMYDKITPHTTRTVLEYAWSPGVEPDIMEWLAANRVICPKLGDVTGPPFLACSGNCQGRVISIAVPNAMAKLAHDIFREKALGSTICGTYVSLLVYVDDYAHFARSLRRLLRQTSTLTQVLGSIHMSLAPHKDAFLVLGSPAATKILLRELNNALTIDGSDPLSLQDIIRYLGGFLKHGPVRWDSTWSILRGRVHGAIARSKMNGFFGKFHSPGATRLVYMSLMRSLLAFIAPIAWRTEPEKAKQETVQNMELGPI
jgi:hypothetical protein